MDLVNWLSKTNFCFANEREFTESGIKIAFHNKHNGQPPSGTISLSQESSDGTLQSVVEKNRFALLVIGLQNGNGLHIGAMGGKSTFNPDFLEEMAQKSGVNAIRNMNYGLNIARDYRPGDKWITADSPSVSVSVCEEEVAITLLKIITKGMSIIPELTNALEIWNAARFYPNSMGRFLLDICAIECIIEHTMTNRVILAWLDSKLEEFEEIACDPEEKDLFRTRLVLLREDSIGSAGRHTF
ncbi:MAG: hypothetical protein HC888_04715 [Candidatus Competibacteraceae bacterium]|nr:hypothetical protein [Candidatus Competibacteraceae bacterium]